ncbi:MAG: stage IV sporulation protein A, partial [Halanaerobiaceae bacterium]
MEEYDIYSDIALRTNGDIYIGVVGPVRSGKSTFVKQFMDQLVLPMIDDKFIKERTQDELPQSSAGKMIMTTEPKFVPEEAINISVDNNISFNVRLIDCVGYTVPGATGYEDEDSPRMVSTPWFDREIPFQEAAEVGTKKVINEHSTIGLVVTTDGSFTGIPRHNFVMAEERIIDELKQIGKPFVVTLNSKNPNSKKTKKLQEKLSEKYEVPIMIIDGLNLKKNDIHNILKQVLYEFPIKEFYIDLPQWMNNLNQDHWLKSNYHETIQKSVEKVNKIRDVDQAVEILADNEYTQEVYLESVNPGEGLAKIQIGLPDRLFYDVIEEFSGFEIVDEGELLELIKELSYAQKEYDRLAEALEQVEEQGYGIVTPSLVDMSFDEPELIQRGNQFGVKLKASAPSIHMIRADINAEVSPVVGTEKKSEEIIQFLEKDFDENPAAIWETEFLGRSLHDLIQEGISNKLYRMPKSAQVKLKDTVEKIVNDGSGGLI